ncbi:hypothetical protein T484DRAFT_2017311, partial [Baffinella frigidus]
MPAAAQIAAGSTVVIRIPAAANITPSPATHLPSFRPLLKSNAVSGPVSEGALVVSVLDMRPAAPAATPGAVVSALTHAASGAGLSLTLEVTAPFALAAGDWVILNLLGFEGPVASAFDVAAAAPPGAVTGGNWTWRLLELAGETENVVVFDREVGVSYLMVNESFVCPQNVSVTTVFNETFTEFVNVTRLVNVTVVRNVSELVPQTVVEDTPVLDTVTAQCQYESQEVVRYSQAYVVKNVSELQNVTQVVGVLRVIAHQETNVELRDGVCNRTVNRTVPFERVVQRNATSPIYSVRSVSEVALQLARNLEANEKFTVTVPAAAGVTLPPEGLRRNEPGLLVSIRGQNGT